MGSGALAAHQCILEEAGEPESRMFTALRALQLLPSTFQFASDPCKNDGAGGRDLAVVGLDGLTIEE